MRKIYSFIIAATAVAAAASCTQELENKVQEQTGETVVFTAVTDGTETKAVLDGTVSKWRGEELITLHDGTNAFTFYGNAGEEPVSSLKFSYTPGEGQPEFTASEVMAVYPSGNYTADLSAKTVGNMVIPDRQSLVEDTYPSTAAVAMAYSTDKETLKFKNATTLLKFKVAGDDVSYGSFVAKAGSGSISGTFDAAYNDGKPVLTATEGKLWVDFQKDDGFLSKEATYYIAVAPAALKGFTIYFNGQEIRSFNSDYTLERNDIINLGTLTYEAPETASVVYLKPGPLWSSDDAWFAAYFFSSTGNKAVKMTDKDEDGIYEAAVPEGDYSKVIFCRMNPKYEEFGWNSETESDHVWNEGNKEYIPSAADDKVCHVVNDWNSYAWQTVEMAAAEWTIAGTFNEWSAAPMTESGDYFVARNVTAANTGSGFKILQKGNWLGYGEVATGVWTALGGGDNITVTGAEAGTAYDVYVNPTTNKFVVVPAGDPMPEDKVTEEEEVVVGYWAVVGTMSNWNDYVQMTLDGDWHVAENVKITVTDQFKFRADENWDVNRGAAGTVDGVILVNNTVTEVYAEGKNFSVSENGFYSIYINKAASKAKVVKTGDLPVESTPDQPSDWALWAETGQVWEQIEMVTTTVPDLFVAKNLNLEAYKSFLVKPSANWNTKYGSGSVNYIKSNKSISLVAGDEAGNITVEAAGLYDIYFDFINKKVYVMAAGTSYTSAAEQTVSGEEPKPEEPEVTANMLYLKPNANWKVDNARFAAYFFGGTSGEKWVSMADSDKDGVYEVNIPEGYGLGCNVIFCRMNPTTAANNWNNKWNQTSDLKAPTDGTNLYTVKDGTWDKGGGTWSVK